jgi:hypothetical protein
MVHLKLWGAGLPQITTLVARDIYGWNYEETECNIRTAWCCGSSARSHDLMKGEVSVTGRAA